MKISLIGPIYPYRGGIAHFTGMLAQKLIKAGHDVQMISFKKQYPLWLYPGKSDKDYSEGREKIDASYLLTPLNPLSWNKVVKAICKFQPQKVIFPWWVTFWGLAFHHIITRLKKNGIPSTILIHNTLPHEAKPYDSFLARWTLQEADNFIVMTQKEKFRLLELLPHIENIGVVPHPIYRVFKPSGKDKKELRSEFGLPPDQPVMLFFGFVRPYKGLNDLLAAQKILISKGFNIILVVAGEFWENRKFYDQQIKDLHLQDYVILFDSYIPEDEVAKFFEASDVFVAPYTGGTQSGALKLALGFGLPIVVTDIVADEMIKSIPRQCKIIETGNVTALANGIFEQLNIRKLDNKEIQLLFDRSWQKLITLITKN